MLVEGIVRWSARRAWKRAAVALIALLCVAPAAEAQKDYYNLDRNRPVRVEDAYATERFALEVKVAPLRLEREQGGVYNWEFHPEVAYGILPRTSVEVGFPYTIVDGGSESGRASGLAGVDLSLFHNLNIETRTLPALGIRADLALPVGSLSGDRVQPSLTGIATRSFSWARIHLNGQYSFDVGSSPENPTEQAHGSPRWLAGVAVDRVFPLDSYLLIADLYASQPAHEADPVQWNAGAGLRYQVNPYLAVDAGLGHTISGDGGWYMTFGSAYHLGFRSLIPGVR